jgi:amino acid permease
MTDSDRPPRKTAASVSPGAVPPNSPPAAGTAAPVAREAGLHRGLSSRQVAMIGLGCTIGTGLFLGSSISV